MSRDAMDAARNETIEDAMYQHEKARHAKQDATRRVAAADRAAYDNAVSEGEFPGDYWEWQAQEECY